MATAEPGRQAIACLRVDDPLVAWLVYRGELASAASVHDRALSFWTTGLLESTAMGHRQDVYEREVRLDLVRGAEFADRPSRLTGFYCFPDSETASRASVLWGPQAFPKARMAAVTIASASTIGIYDSTWITRGPPVSDPSWMRSYYAGELTNDPLIELVVSGRAAVVDRELREAAYQVVASTWPKSLPLLELGRLAAKVGSDLGMIAGVPMYAEAGVRVRYILNMVDASNEIVMRRLRDFIDAAGISSPLTNDEITLPDLGVSMAIRKSAVVAKQKSAPLAMKVRVSGLRRATTSS